MVAAYLSTDESLADLRCGVLDTGCNNTCYTGSGLRGLFNRSMGAPIQGASGISKPGTKGDSYVYFCSADPNQQGTVHLVKGQSVESFPRDLISTDQFTFCRVTWSGWPRIARSHTEISLSLSELLHRGTNIASKL